MAPRRGEILEERKEGEPSEVVERISAMEGKFSTMEGRLGSIEEMLKQLVEAQSRVHLIPKKGRDFNPNPNSIPTTMEEEASWVKGTLNGQFTNGGPFRVTEEVGRPADREPTWGGRRHGREGMAAWGRSEEAWVEEVRWGEFGKDMGEDFNELRAGGTGRRKQDMGNHTGEGGFHHRTTA